MKRDTVGKISSELLIKDPDSRNPIELEQEMHTDYDKHIYDCVETSRHIYPGNFYVVVIVKKEPLMQNVLRNYFFSRSTCPAPDYDQTVYFYDRQEERIEFLWVIPSKDTCLYMKEHALEIPFDEHELLKFVLDFSDGTLYKKARHLNGEEPLPATI